MLNKHSKVFFCYFLSRALTFMFASKMAQLGFFLPSMPQPGIKLMSVQLYHF